MEHDSKKTSTGPAATPKPDFNGAAIIDENGREIAITEQMIQQALSELDNRRLARDGSGQKKSQSREN